MPTFEELIDERVGEKVNELIPAITESIRTKLSQEKEFKEINQILFTQKEMAKKQGVSVTTFVKWRKMGLQSESSPTGKLLFDLNNVNKWRKENDPRKAK